MVAEEGELEWQAELLCTLSRVLFIGGAPAAAHVIFAVPGVPVWDMVVVLIALRHAQAREVSVTLEYDPASVRLRVRDDGCGFDPAPVRGAGGAHLGLVGMRERARALGGTCTVSSARGRGTQIVVQLPLARAT
jgi:hypothetical protein